MLSRLSHRTRLVLAGLVLALMVAGIAGWLTRAPSAAAMAVKAAPLVRTLQFSARVATVSRVELGPP